MSIEEQVDNAIRRSQLEVLERVRTKLHKEISSNETMTITDKRIMFGKVDKIFLIETEKLKGDTK